MNLIEQIDRENIRRLTADRRIRKFRAGDTVKVLVKVVEGTRERMQSFEGVVIARKNGGINSSFKVRKIASGEGVERLFHLYSPNIQIEVIKHGRVRRAKLYYLRQRTGKSSRISEKKRVEEFE
ncbi:MAG: 50S ribosomal protein L19 [Holosporales bacterium]|jgi:large subunit ribosomal protein L19|nr:50S ribosomal protein L19 [Holosporales bacterium]